MNHFLSKLSPLIGIILIALTVRLIGLGMNPPSLNWDEVSLGYNSYSILKTGKDEWGRTFPITFEAFGDYKLPVYIYTSIPFIALFGLNEYGVRLPSVLAGIFGVILIYLIVNELTSNKKLALIGAALLAVSPWDIFLSRVALEAHLALFLFLLGFYTFLKGIKRNWSLLLSALFFGTTIFTYNSARVFVPVFVLFLVFRYRKVLWNKKLIGLIFILLFSMFFGIAAFLAVFVDSSSRYYWVSIVDQGAINYLNESRAQSQLPKLITNLIYNRYSYFIQNFVTNFLNHFSVEYLFLKGGSQYQFSLPGHGLLYLIELPFLAFGIIRLIQKRTYKDIRGILLTWLILAPIPSAITRESPHALRAIFMLGVVQIITAVGIMESINVIRDRYMDRLKIFLAVVVTLFLVSFVFYGYQYFLLYPYKYSFSWQYGYKEVIEYLSYNNYLNSSQKVYISKKYGEPHIFYLFYIKYDPLKYQNNPSLIRYDKTNWRWVDRLDNISFINDWEVKKRLEGEKGSILVTSPGNFPAGSEVIYSVNFLNGSKAFDVVKI